MNLSKSQAHTSLSLTKLTSNRNNNYLLNTFNSEFSNSESDNSSVFEINNRISISDNTESQSQNINP